MNPLIIHATPNINQLLVTSEAQSRPIDFIVDWRTYTWWESADSNTQEIVWSPTVPTAVSDIAISGHNLSSIGAFISLIGSDDGFVSDLHNPVLPEPVISDEVFYRRFEPQIKSQWKIVISGLSNPAKIAILSIGEAVEIEGPITGEYAPISTQKNSVAGESRGGALLGVVQSALSTKARVSITRLSDPWYRGVFESLWYERLGSLAPFFWAHNLTIAPNDIYLMRMESSKLESSYTISGKRNIQLKMVGV